MGGEREDRILVTGASGFVGPWALRALAEAAPDALVVGTRRDSGDAGPQDVTLDIRDRGSVAATVRDLRPTAVLHLAAVSEIAAARRDPAECWSVNLGGTMALGEAILAHAPGCRLVYAGTGDAYGRSFRERDAPLDETAPLEPSNPYAASKAAADLLVGQLAADGLDAVRFRPFNHTGPGQSERFVAPAFAAQVARAELGLGPAVIHVGDLSAERDFLDVRDVARAYAAALVRRRPLPSGLAMNLASGAPRRIGAMLDALVSMSATPVEIRVDPERLRPSDIPRAVGDATRARRLLGWAPTIPWEKTLADVLADWRVRARPGS